MASRARNKLNVKQVAAFSGPGLHSDGGGLYLRIRKSGRSWFYIGAISGKRIELGLGPAVDISLARAREKAAAIRAMILDGIDPREARKPKQSAPKPKATFGAFALKFLDSVEDGFKNPKHRQQWRNTLTTYAEPMFDLPIENVTTEHVLEVLQPIWLTKPETASRLRGRIERVLDAAKARGLRGGENPARRRGNLDLLLSKRAKGTVRHHPALPFIQVANFMAELRQRDTVTAKALEFVILTAARSGEVRGATWGEIDLEAKVWTVPATRMKAAALHEVPLSEDALVVLQSMRFDDPGPTDFVFPAPRGGHLSDMALTQLLKRMGRTAITVHGFRSTFRDWAGEVTQFEREVVEMALAHTVGSAVEMAYRRGRALEKRRDLMAAWSAYCDAQSRGPEEKGETA